MQEVGEGSVGGGEDGGGVVGFAEVEGGGGGGEFDAVIAIALAGV
jgi:hypothetical protein